MNHSEVLSCARCQKNLENIKSIFLVESEQAMCAFCFLRFPRRESYRLIHPLGQIPLFKEDWSCREELKLLEELHHQGFGSWQNIAKNLETKSPEECETHYMQVAAAQQFWWNNQGRLADLPRLVDEIVGAGSIVQLRREAGTELRRKIEESFKKTQRLEDKALEECLCEGIIRR